MSGSKRGGKPWNSDFWLAELSKLSNDHALKSGCWETAPPKEPSYFPKEEPENQQEEEEDVPAVEDIHVDWTLDDEIDNVKEQPKPSSAKLSSSVEISQLVSLDEDDIQPSAWQLLSAPMVPTPVNVRGSKSIEESIMQPNPSPVEAAQSSTALSEPISPLVSKSPKSVPANETSPAPSYTLSAHEIPTILSPVPSPVPQSSSPVVSQASAKENPVSQSSSPVVSQASVKENLVSSTTSMKSPPASQPASLQETSVSQSASSSPVLHSASVEAAAVAPSKDLSEWTQTPVPEWNQSSVQIVPVWTQTEAKPQPSLWEPSPAKDPVSIKSPTDAKKVLWQPAPVKGSISIKSPTESAKESPEPSKVEKPVGIELPTEATEKLWEPSANSARSLENLAKEECHSPAAEKLDPVKSTTEATEMPWEPAAAKKPITINSPTESTEKLWEPAPAKKHITINSPTESTEKLWQPAAAMQPISIKQPSTGEKVWQPTSAKKAIIIKPSEEIWQPAKSKPVEIKPASPTQSNASPGDTGLKPIKNTATVKADSKPIQTDFPAQSASVESSVATLVDPLSATMTPVSKSVDGGSVQNDTGPFAATGWTAVDKEEEEEEEEDESGSEYETDSDASVEQITINLASLVKSFQQEEDKNSVPIIHCTLTDLILGTKSARIREIVAELTGEKKPSDHGDASVSNVDENRSISISASSVKDACAYESGDAQTNDAAPETLHTNGSPQQQKKKAEGQRDTTPKLNASAPSFTPKFAIPQTNDKTVHAEEEEEEDTFIYEPSYVLEDEYVDDSSSAALYQSSSLFSPPQYFDSSYEPGYPP